MHIEFRHLRTIKAIHEEGRAGARGGTAAHHAERAVSHQIKGLEDQAGVELFVRRSRPMRLSSAGLKLLRLAEDVLPRLAALEEEFEGLRSGKSGRLHIAIECHACFDWLLPVLEAFRVSWPEVDVDIRPGLQFEALAGAPAGGGRPRGVVGPRGVAGCRFHTAFRLRTGLRLCARIIRLAAKAWIEAEDFAEQHLITYPVERSRLDVFSQLLFPAGVEPRSIRQVELSAVMLLLVASGRGVAVLARLGGAGPAHASPPS
jgi:LysR family transcriptional regulator for metE and metH